MSMRKLVLAVAVAAACVAIAGCATSRVAYTQSDQRAAAIPSIPEARFWSDDHAAVGAIIAKGLKNRAPGPFRMLALSGGGANGAYGAGFLNGWTRAGTRPDFTIVTGVSVGALMAPFAYLGPDYDFVLAEMFTDGEATGLMEFAGLEVLFGSSAFSDVPLKKLVEKYVDRELLDRIADEYHKGRLLLVATTDVDSQRTAVWNMGAIAASTSPGAPELFRTVLLASASVPGIFAPEPIRVEADGKSFSELHVDGGVTANLLLVPQALLATELAVSLGRDPQFYAVVNGKLGPEFKVTRTGVINIVQRSFETTLKSNTTNQLLATRDYLQKRRGELHITAIDPAYPLGDLMDFSAAQTAPLFAAGVAAGMKERRWLADPFD